MMASSPPLDFAEIVLNKPFSSALYSAHRLLTEHTGKIVLQGNHGHMDLELFAKAGRCKLTINTDKMHPHSSFDWDEGDEDDDNPTLPSAENNFNVLEITRNVWYDVEWEGHCLDYVLLALPCPGEPTMNYYFLITDDQAVGERLIAECSKFNFEKKDTIFVFSDGYWSDDEKLFQGVKASTFDNLILSPQLKSTIKKEIDTFFASRELYARYGAPWKRGFLFSGPPGNGKTHLLKAVINHVLAQKDIEVAILYVKSFKGCGQPDEYRIARIFERARARPSLLIFEDLDSLITDENRSFFLNEVDGLVANSGVMTVATTNHPDRLDVAIRDRPSRFDRHFTFALPTAAERLAFIKLWATDKGEEVALADESAQELCSDEITGGFSFAYMKELMLASIVSWLSSNGEDDRVPFAKVLMQQAEVLRRHVRREEQEESSDHEEDEETMSPVACQCVRTEKPVN
ncbi:hypothetical protein HDU86_004606 [Geranomyces michiganensis]|nr:hypothetical protein HDU86_004606 [Geranomyces michiganensis]